jgi:hypothetical protein
MDNSVSEPGLPRLRRSAAKRVLFGESTWYHRILHNETAYAIQRRLRFASAAIAGLTDPITRVAPALRRNSTAQATELPHG